MEDLILHGISHEDFKTDLRFLINDVIDSKLIALKEELKHSQKPKYGTIQDVCSELSISKPTLHKLLNEGYFTRHRIRGRVLISWAEIESKMDEVNNRKWKRK